MSREFIDAIASDDRLDAEKIFTQTMAGKSWRLSRGKT